jgi:hypothetical protein
MTQDLKRRTLQPDSTDSQPTPSAEPIARPERLTLRPPYRRGAHYVRCGLRLRRDVWHALQLESRQRRRWASDLAQELLLEGLAQRRRVPVSPFAQIELPPANGAPTGERHWVRLALEQPLWEVLQRRASGTAYSPAQRARQLLTGAVLATERASIALTGDSFERIDTVLTQLGRL